MVNVTKKNFLEQSNDLLEYLPSAAFVAIDEEMTGISLPGWKRPKKDDTPAERYNSLKKVPERYTIIQVGISLFHANPMYDKNLEPELNFEPEFFVRTYNFYLFPPSSNNEYTREVTLNPSSIAFLSSHNMDFNMWMQDGIPYVTGQTARHLMTKFEERYDKKREDEGKKESPTKKKPIELTRPDDITFQACAMAGLREWIDAASPVEILLDETEKNTHEGLSYDLPSCNSFLRRSLYETIQAEYPSLILEKLDTDQIRVWRLNPAEKLLREQRLEKEAWEHLLVNQVGFWRIFQALSDACNGREILWNYPPAKSADSDPSQSERVAKYDRRRIPIVVHNGLMDLLFLMTHFDSHTLPASYSDAKTMIHDYFPVVYDTKILSTEYSDTGIRNESTALGDLYKKLCPNGLASLKHMNRDENEEEGGQAHEAAYDALMTGSIYLTLCTRIMASLPSEDPVVDEDEVGCLEHLLEEGENKPQNEENARFLFGRNKLYLMSCLYTIDLEETNQDPFSRGMSPSTTYRVSGSDTSVNTRDILWALSGVSSIPEFWANGAIPERRVTIFELIWIDDSTFLIATRSPPDSTIPGDQLAAALKRQGDLVLAALKDRFKEQEVISLEEYLTRMLVTTTGDELDKTPPSYGITGFLTGIYTGVANALGFSKRKRPDSVESEQGGNKRRKIEV